MEPNVAIACNLNTFTDAERTNYIELRARIELGTEEVVEFETGFALRVPTDPSFLAALGEWIGFERRCCPFFTFDLNIPGDGPASLRITGPDGAKDVLRDALQRRIVRADRLRRR